jgi:type III secretion system YscD/HrpQ family protein
MAARVELRMLSGAAVGAALELGAGEYLIGSDADCDVALAAEDTLAGKHARLEVRAAKGRLSVWVRPQEGAARLNGLDLPAEGADLPAGEVLSLGFVALAWRRAGEAWEAVSFVPLEYARAILGQEAPTATAEAGEAGTEGAEGVDTDGVERAEKSAPEATNAVANAAAGSEAAGTEAGTKAARSNPFLAVLRWFFWAVAILLLSSVAAWLAQDYLQAPSSALAVDDLNARLQAAGFSAVRASANDAGDSGAITLTGVVENDQRLSGVLRLAAELPLRTRVEVRVAEDVLRMVRETLNTHGFFPAVRYVDAARSDGRLALTLYLKDGFVEARMLALSQDAPRLVNAERRVIDAKTLAPVLSRELRAIGLEGDQVEYLPGSVALPYRLTAAQQSALDAALNRVRKALDAPVMFEMRGHRPPPAAAPVAGVPAAGGLPGENAPALAPTTSAAASETAEQPGDPWGGLRVTGVTVGEIPFVSTSDGQKFFPGAVLPNGAVLVGIALDALKIQNGGEMQIYPLKEK